MKKIEWVVTCSRCGQIDKMYNGDFIEAIAKKHAGECDGSVMVGYYITANGEPVGKEE